MKCQAYPATEEWFWKLRHGLIEDDWPLFDQLSKRRRSRIITWIKKNARARKTENMRHTSYGIKAYFERSESGFYVSNGQFKGAMLAAGFEPISRRELNWTFRCTYSHERAWASRRAVSAWGDVQKLLQRKADRRDELEREKRLILDGVSGQVAESSGAIQSARGVIDGIADRYGLTRQEVLALVRIYSDRELRRRSRKDKRP